MLRVGSPSVAMLRFAVGATIDEHDADHDIDVHCIEGSGMVSVGNEQVAIESGQRIRWPAGRPHRLWTEDTTMVTLMLEHDN